MFLDQSSVQISTCFIESSCACYYITCRTWMKK
uniref:Uncharacterized protein n=1 Tax=Arundo donax TaxID=35708 RepID=A0A0A9EPU3_ARUDO